MSSLKELLELHLAAKEGSDFECVTTSCSNYLVKSEIFALLRYIQIKQLLATLKGIFQLNVAITLHKSGYFR